MSSLKSPPHPLKVETCYISQFFQHHQTLPKVETVINQLLQDNHTLLKVETGYKIRSFMTIITLPKQKLLKFSSFKTTTSLLKQKLVTKSGLSCPSLPSPKQKLLQIRYCQHHLTPSYTQKLLEISSLMTAPHLVQSRN